ncbi:MAG: ABC transporter substrate-binding protein [Thermomicrobiales bacterium]
MHIPAAGARQTLAASTPAAGGWAFTDDRGITASFDHTPASVVAAKHCAAGLWDFGFDVAGYFWGPPGGGPDIVSARTGFDTVPMISDGCAIDMEQMVSLKPDLVVDVDRTTGNVLSNVCAPGELAQIEAMSQTLSFSDVGVSRLRTIEKIGELAASLGADIDTPDIQKARSTFMATQEALDTAIQEKPGLRVLVLTILPDNAMVIVPHGWSDLTYYREQGITFVDPSESDPTLTLSTTISAEQLGEYPADLIMLGDIGLQSEDIATVNEVWSTLPAVQHGQVIPWPAHRAFSYQGFEPIVRAMADAVKRAEIVTD